MLKPPLVLMHGTVSYGLEGSSLWVLDGGLVMEKILVSMKIGGHPRENGCRIILCNLERWFSVLLED